MKTITLITLITVATLTACGGEERRSEASETAVAKQEIRKIVQEELKKELMHLQTSESIRRINPVEKSQKIEVQHELEKQAADWRKEQEEVDRKLQKIAEEEQRQRWQQEVDRMYGP